MRPIETIPLDISIIELQIGTKNTGRSRPAFSHDIALIPSHFNSAHCAVPVTRVLICPLPNCADCWIGSPTTSPKFAVRWPQLFFMNWVIFPLPVGAVPGSALRVLGPSEGLLLLDQFPAPRTPPKCRCAQHRGR